MRKIILLMITLLCAATQGLQAQEKELTVAERNALQGFNDTIDRLADDFVEAYVVIADPGTRLYSVLGHCALRLKCDAFNLDYIFSYESEDATRKTLSFLAGHLKMGLFAIPIDEYCATYIAEGRGVRQYKLWLSPIEEQELWRIMDDECARGANLDYDYYHRGCANSCLRFVTKALHGNRIHYAPWDRECVSGRELVREHTKKALWVRFVTCFISGNEVDEPLCGERQLLIPEDLAAAWKKATFDGHPLLSSEPEILVDGTPQTNDPWFTPLIFSIIILLLSIANLFYSKPYYDWFILGGQTLIGLLMTYLLFVSDLCCTDWNWLYVAFNPLPALFWRWRKYWALPFAGVLIMWCVAMLVMLLRNEVLVDWPHIILALSFCVVLLKQSPLLARSV